MLGYTCAAYWVIPVQCTGSYLFNVMSHTSTMCWVIPAQHAGSYLCSVLGHTCAVSWSYLNSVLGHTCALCWAIPVQCAGSYLCNMLGHTCTMSNVRQRHRAFITKPFPQWALVTLVTSKITPSDNKTGQLNFNIGFERNRQAIADLSFRKYSPSLSVTPDCSRT